MQVRTLLPCLGNSSLSSFLCFGFCNTGLKWRLRFGLFLFYPFSFTLYESLDVEKRFGAWGAVIWMDNMETTGNRSFG